MAMSRTILHGATAPERTALVAALTMAGGAVVCGVCCVLPFAFPAVAAAGTGSLLAWFGAHNWATTVAAAIVAGAWISIGFQSHRARKSRRVRRSTRWRSPQRCSYSLCFGHGSSLM
jgi:hypothetical protein